MEFADGGDLEVSNTVKVETDREKEEDISMDWGEIDLEYDEASAFWSQDITWKKYHS